MNGIKLRTMDCEYRKCSHLIERVDFGRKKRVCDMTGKIPGNMGKCPVEV